MFYEPDKNNHGLRYNPFKSIVVPRPIGWITTLGLDGKVNLAPYSQFQNIGFDPPYVMFAASTERDKHSASNAMDTGEFVTNMANYRNLTRNILREYRTAADAEHLAGVSWYDAAFTECERIAWRNGFTVTQAAVAMAHLSPSIQWRQNVD